MKATDMRILVTGGAGYIGSHACVELLQAGYEVIVVDSLINSREESIRRVTEITGKKLRFHKVDLLDKAGLAAVFQETAVDAVIHFAGLKAVGDTVAEELKTRFLTPNFAMTSKSTREPVILFM